jgi:trans-aconitate methyltransferase
VISSKAAANKKMSDFWNTHLYDNAHSFVTKYGEDVVALLNPRVGEEILDLGCGTGHLTAQIAESGASVIGLDASRKMLEVAKQTYPEIEWVEANATEFELEHRFDAVFTNAVLHWILEPQQVVQRVYTHLKSGGRFVGEFGGQGNVFIIQDALRQSAIELGLPDFKEDKYFPSIANWATVLENAGFETRFVTLFNRPTSLQGPDGPKTWLRQFRALYLEKLNENEQEEVLDKAQAKLKGVLENEHGWFADYRRIRFVAVKAES